MADGSSIQWTDATWNPIRGCSKVSEGCRNCYAMGVAARFSGPGLPYDGLGKMTPTGPAWTNKVRIVPAHLYDPLRWSRPRRIFVNSMSDLFHEAVAIETIADVFAVMYLAPRHTFQVLTKRARRMRDVLTHPKFYRLVLNAADTLRAARPKLTAVGVSDPTKFPAPWVHLGVSVEDQKSANERIPELLATPASVRFLSCEPLLEHVDLTDISFDGLGRNALRVNDETTGERHVDWVIIGGESGSNARRFEAEWARSLVTQCRKANIAPFVKQMGSNTIDRNDAGFNGDDDDGWHSAVEYGGDIRVEHDLDGHRDDYQGAPVRVHLRDRHGGDPAEWPADLRVREFPTPRGA